MNIDLMRKLDSRVGIPLCFIASIFAIFRKSRPRPLRSKNVLFLELSEMGSTILSLPAIRKLQRQCDVNIYFLTFKRNIEFLRLTGVIEEERILGLNDKSLFSLTVDCLKFLILARKNQIDTVLDLELFSRFTMLLSALSGAKKKVGFHAFRSEGLYRGNLLTHRVPFNPHIHISNNFLALVSAALSTRYQPPFSGETVAEKQPGVSKLHISNEEKMSLITKLRDLAPSYQSDRHRLIIINPNCGRFLPIRKWKPERFSALIHRILEEDRNENTIIVLIGASEDFSYTQSISSSFSNTKCLNAAGKFSLSEIAALFSISTLFLSNDSGLAHIAALTDIPNFVIFGPETPSLYAPPGATVIYSKLYCSPCLSVYNHKNTPCTNPLCLDKIKVDQVYESLKKYLIV